MNTPAPEVRRAMLEERIGMYRAAAFEAYVEAEAMRVQTPLDEQEGAEQAQRLQVLEQKSANCYASAARLQELLDAVNAEPGSPAG